jgi:hypothetical protein
MLHKCANPACSSLFRSLGRGKLFLLDRDTRLIWRGGWRHASPLSRSDLSRARSIGELAVHRESLERVLMENLQSLQVILDALLDALRQEIAVEAKPVSLRKAEREEEKELCGGFNRTGILVEGRNTQTSGLG